MNNNRCRLCLDINCAVLPIFQKKNDVLLAKLTDVLQVKLRMRNGLPGGMCSDCASQLEAAYTFKQRCLESQEQLKGQTKQTVRKISSKLRGRRQSKKRSKIDDVGSEDEPHNDVPVDTDSKDWPVDNAPTHTVYLPSVDESQSCDEVEKNAETVKVEPTELLECSFCEAHFTSSEQLENHVNTHEEKKDKPPPKCLVCKKTFPTQSKLRTHMVDHIGESAVQCLCCDKVFLNETYLNHHLESSHKRATSVINTTKSFKCVTCNKSFLKQAHLIEHTRTHTGDRPFKCPSCEKRFTTKCNLTRHMRTHVPM